MCGRDLERRNRTWDLQVLFFFFLFLFLFSFFFSQQYEIGWNGQWWGRFWAQGEVDTFEKGFEDEG